MGDKQAKQLNPYKAKPGQVLSKRGGRPKGSKNVRTLLKEEGLSGRDIIKGVAKALAMTFDEMDIKLKDSSQPVYEKILMSVCHKAIKVGDIARMEWLIRTAFGQSTDEMFKVYIQNNTINNVLVNVQDKEILERYQQKIRHVDVNNRFAG